MTISRGANWLSVNVLWLGLLVGLEIGECAAALGGQRLEVSGILKGFFLTPEGQLCTRDLPLTKPTAGPRGERLHPLWATYFLEATLSADERIRRARIVSPKDGRVFYDKRLEPALAEVRLPVTPGHFVGVHARHGLRLRFEAELEDGSWRRGDAVVGARRLQRPALRIDWLELIRIAEVRRLLREHGDEILPGLRADDVPFAIQGDEGQCVLVDHPDPPEGFRRYQGPLPLPARVVVGRWGAPRGHASAVALTGPVNGVQTVVVGGDPAWWSLPDEGVNEAGLGPRQLDRLQTLVHEVAHCHWVKRAPPLERVPLEALAPPSLEFWAIEGAERAVLEKALDASAGELPGVVREYLALREIRHQLPPAARMLTSAQEWMESAEAYAYYAESRLLPILAASVAPEDTEESGEFDEEAPDVRSELDFDLHDLASVLPTLHGAGQAHLLELLSPEGVVRGWQQGLPISTALAEASGYSRLTPEQRRALQAEARARYGCDDALRAMQDQERTARRSLGDQLLGTETGQAVLLRVVLALGRSPEPAKADGAPPRYFRSYAATWGDMEVAIRRPCLARHAFSTDGARVQFDVPMAGTHGVLLLERRGDGLTLRGEGVMLHAPYASLHWRRGELSVHGSLRQGMAESDQGNPKQERQMERLRWMAIPLAALTCSTVMASLPTQEPTTTLYGLFRDVSSSPPRDEVLTLNLLDYSTWPAGNWQTIVGETYTMTATVADASYPLIAEVAAYDLNGNLLDRETADPPTSSLTAQGTFVATEAFTPDVEFTAEAWLRDIGGILDDVWKWIERLKKKGAPTYNKVVVGVVHGDGTAFSGAKVAVWPEGQPEQRQWTFTGPSGEVFWYLPTQKSYMLEAWREPNSGEAWCHVTQGPFRLRVQEKEMTKTFMLMTHHCIRGKVFFQGGGGPAGLLVRLYQGETLKETGRILPQDPVDGGFPYEFGPHVAGGYTVKATYAGQEQNEPVTVEDDCSPLYAGNPGYTTMLTGKGQHSAISGPTFTF